MGALFDALPQALALVFDPYTLAVGLLATIFGLFVGAMPGLTATMAVALLIPVTFFIPPVPALVAIVMSTSMAIFAGDIPGALLRIPGTPASAAYADDAYLLTKQGKGELALGICLVTSAIGGIFGTIVLIVLAPPLADFALKFSMFEYFWLVTLGLTCAVFVTGNDLLRGVIGILIGLTIASVGQDVSQGHPRYTFGVKELLSGIDFIPAMVGMFAVSELMRRVTETAGTADFAQTKFKSFFTGLFPVLRKYQKNIWRGNTIGTAIGILPGAGADIAAWISYSVGKRFSKNPEKFGKGSEEGLVDAGAANNSAIAGAWVPALVFGIPGDSVTAVVIGMLMMKNIQPGPEIFIEKPVEMSALMIAFILANIIMIPIGIMAIRVAAKVLVLNRAILIPLILLFCIVGSFAINNNTFAIWVMFAMGILAWFMEANDIPIAPAILGIVLGDMLEKRFLTGMMQSDGRLLAFVERPIAATLAALTMALWIGLAWKAWKGRA
jgi:putative tricarboxylic transport membrane protein